MSSSEYFYTIDANGNLILQTGYGEQIYALPPTLYPENPAPASPVCCCGFLCPQESTDTP